MKFLGAPSSGSIAGQTFSHNRAGQYQRNRRSPVQPVGTGRRAFIRASFGASSSAWAALTPALQAAWNAFAAGYPVVDSLGQTIFLTGHQMFVSVYTQLQNCNAAPSTAVPLSSAVFAAGAFTFTATAAGVITVTPAGAGTAADFLTIAFSRPVSGGRTFMKTFWQCDVLAGDVSVATVETVPYGAQFGLATAGQKIFCKITPVNQYGMTGTPVIQAAVVT
jgi:hypothetical protein